MHEKVSAHLDRPMTAAEKSLAPGIRAALTDAVGASMAEKIIVGACNILSLDEDELYGEGFDQFVMRMETTLPAIIGLRPGEAVVKGLWELKHGSSP